MNRNITATILIILAIGTYLTYTKGVVDEALAIKSGNDQYVAALNSAEQLIKVRDQVRDSYNNLSQEDRDRLSKIVPSSVNNIRLIIDLNYVALKNGFSLRGVKAVASNDSTTKSPPAATQANANQGLNISTPTLNTVTVTFAATASYQQFLTFLEDIEASLRILDISTLNMSVGENGLYNFDVQLKTYWLRQ